MGNKSRYTVVDESFVIDENNKIKGVLVTYSYIREHDKEQIYIKMPVSLESWEKYNKDALKVIDGFENGDNEILDMGLVYSD